MKTSRVGRLRQNRRPGLALGALLALAAAYTPTARADIGRFDGYEIRVIRPRYMAKRSRIELGGEGVIIMNQAFVYTFLATGILDYHFSEMFALELDGAYGFSVDKDDKKTLQNDFKISTQILRTQYIAGGGLLWTPIYGKTQLASGQVVYFDSFLTAQAGMTGVQYTYEQCPEPRATVPSDPNKPPAVTKGYPTVNVGFGQKYFLSQDFGLRWDVRDYIFQYEKGDGTCTPDLPQGKAIQHEVTLQFGASTFF